MKYWLHTLLRLFPSVHCSLEDKAEKQLGQKPGILPQILFKTGFRESHLLRSPRKWNSALQFTKHLVSPCLEFRFLDVEASLPGDPQIFISHQFWQKPPQPGTISAVGIMDCSAFKYQASITLFGRGFNDILILRTRYILQKMTFPSPAESSNE